MSTSFTTSLDFCLLAAGLFLLHRLFKRAPLAPLPPGPKPLPIIGVRMVIILPFTDLSPPLYLECHRYAH